MANKKKSTIEYRISNGASVRNSIDLPREKKSRGEFNIQFHGLFCTIFHFFSHDIGFLSKT